MKIKAALLLAFSAVVLSSAEFELKSSGDAPTASVEVQKASVKAKNRRAGRSPAVDSSAIVADAEMIRGEALAHASPSSI